MKNDFFNKKIKILFWGVILIGFVSLGIFVQSCSNEIDGFPTKNQRQEYVIASRYLELIDNQYVLLLSEKQALSLGISQSVYFIMQDEIRQTNAYIIDCQIKGIEIDVNDPQKIQVSSSNIRLKKDDEGGSVIMPPSGSGGSCSFFAASDVKSITITGATPCFIGTIYGTVVCGGQTINYSITGLSGGSKTINLPVSNTNVTVTCDTPCSGGGTVVVTKNK